MCSTDSIFPSFSNTKHYVYSVFLTSQGNKEKKGICLEEGSIPRKKQVQKYECMEVREMFGGEDNNPSASLDQQHVSRKDSIVL